MFNLFIFTSMHKIKDVSSSDSAPQNWRLSDFRKTIVLSEKSRAHFKCQSKKIKIQKCATRSIVAHRTEHAPWVDVNQHSESPQSKKKTRKKYCSLGI